MLILPGSSALSEARTAKRLARLRTKNPEVTRLSATFVHFVDAARALSVSERAVLEQLLSYGPRQQANAQSVPDGQRSGVATGNDVTGVWVVPRLGTISPWSSKATDIAHVCGLDAVRRIERGIAYAVSGSIRDAAALRSAIHDRMTESALESAERAAELFLRIEPKTFARVELLARGQSAIEQANQELGLALAADEIAYLAQSYRELGRDPSDVELMMFAQANSEHCRHKIFNADFIVDGVASKFSLFRMIQQSTQASPTGVLSAYSDNAAVIQGSAAGRFFPDPEDSVYRTRREAVHILMKVETHNHPTAISPYPGAATGSGGEIRDEGATGRGAKPKAGLTGFSVSNLRLPGHVEPWEGALKKPDRIASALEIMIDGPLGGAAFNNEFGRPNLVGYFRTFELEVAGPNGRDVRGYHKPIMVAGGIGNIRAEHVDKAEIPVGAALVVLGGPAMLIGLGGGAASSVASGTSHEDLDFASVQRDNAEMQRRCQEVIDRAWGLGKNNPILSIHDVGAGGLSNALPELVHGSGRGAALELRKIPNDEPGMSPLQVWCNEAQERYVLAIAEADLPRFGALCARERCPYAVLGHATAAADLAVSDAHFRTQPIDLPLSVLFGKPPKMTRDVRRETSAPERASEADAADGGSAALTRGMELREALLRVLRLPTVADKTFLITIGDRSVSGLVARDQMVGPWQVPVADVAVTATSYDAFVGEAMAIGERAPLALLDAAASARMAVAEAITNIAAAPISKLSDIKLSANWMAAAGHAGEDARLFDAVRAIGTELCPALGIAIPVGKDSLSMRTVWEEDGVQQRVIAPLSVIVSAFAPVSDIRHVLTPELQRDRGATELLLIDLGRGQNRLGGSALLQVYDRLGHGPPDLDDPRLLSGFFAAIQALSGAGLLLAYHDRSDGGVFATLVEMAFAGGTGLALELAGDESNPLEFLCAEELGAVIQVKSSELERVRALLREHLPADCVCALGQPTPEQRVTIRHGARLIFDEARSTLRAHWSRVTHTLQALRDEPGCADQEHEARLRDDDPGLNAIVSFDPNQDISAPFANRARRPRVAILREQGVNGQIEMAQAFDRAGFDAVDVHMTDLLEGRTELSGFHGLAACGGFSYGDVLGAGGGWAKSISFNARACRMFERFFERSDAFALGVCNGCQMLSNLSNLIPGAELWPRFVRNRSEQFEARLCLVEVEDSPSILLSGMQGSRLPIVVAHGEGRAEFESDAKREALEAERLVPLRYVDHFGKRTEHYPENPNGSPGGISAVTTPSGRVTLLMPHPERVFRSVQYSWRPADWGDDGPWLRLFRNARAWVG